VNEITKISGRNINEKVLKSQLDIPITLSLVHPVSGKLFLTAFASANQSRKKQE
jgi:hypothetical protein